jgi:hypothetical protein
MTDEQVRFTSLVSFSTPRLTQLLTLCVALEPNDMPQDRPCYPSHPRMGLLLANPRQVGSGVRRELWDEDRCCTSAFEFLCPYQASPQISLNHSLTCARSAPCR